MRDKWDVKILLTYKNLKKLCSDLNEIVESIREILRIYIKSKPVPEKVI